MSGLLSAGTLTRLRAVAERALPDTCTISRPSAGSTGRYGGSAPGSAPTVATVACHVAPMSQVRGGASQTGAGVETFVGWAIRMPHGTDVRVKDVITANGQTYRVQQVNAGRSEAVNTIAYATSEAS